MLFGKRQIARQFLSLNSGAPARSGERISDELGLKSCASQQLYFFWQLPPLADVSTPAAALIVSFQQAPVES
jgi:hypothetical protein